ncbi:MAG: hypothetical protein ACRCX5_07245, partial [Bacteroidales bacterium]
SIKKETLFINHYIIILLVQFNTHILYAHSCNDKSVPLFLLHLDKLSFCYKHPQYNIYLIILQRQIIGVKLSEF